LPLRQVVPTRGDLRTHHIALAHDHSPPTLTFTGPPASALPRGVAGRLPAADAADPAPLDCGRQPPRAGTGAHGGEPVDLASGLFVLQKTDLVLPGRLPLALTRTYRTLDDSPGPFGPGTSHAYEVFLSSLSPDAFLLTLPGNSRALFARRVDMSEESPK
jgi:hypothetical protein